MFIPLRVNVVLVIMMVGLQSRIVSAYGIPRTVSSVTQRCGITALDSRAKIFGGEEVALGAFPWMAAIGYSGLRNKKIKWNCGGSLIASRWVLTAAHCVDHRMLREKKIAEVRLGEHTFGLTPDCQDSPLVSTCAPQPQVYDVFKVVQWPDFNPNNINAGKDIALIKLDGEATITAWVSPVCLPSPDFRPNQATIGIAAGWGLTEDYIKSKVLLSVSLPYINHACCSQKYDGKVSESQLCFGGLANKDTCYGDSGGPLVVLDNKQQTYTLAGVVSYGLSCGQEGVPGIYTSVSYYLNWIHSVIGERMKTHESITFPIINEFISVTESSTNSIINESSSDTEISTISIINESSTSSDTESSTNSIINESNSVSESSPISIINESSSGTESPTISIINESNSGTESSTISKLNESSSNKTIHGNFEDKNNTVNANATSVLIDSNSANAIHDNVEQKNKTVNVLNVMSNSCANCTVVSSIQQDINVMVASSVMMTTPISMFTSSISSFAVEAIESTMNTQILVQSTSLSIYEETTKVEKEKQVEAETHISIKSTMNAQVFVQSTSLSVLKETAKVELDQQSELHVKPVMTTTQQVTIVLSPVMASPAFNVAQVTSRFLLF